MEVLSDKETFVEVKMKVFVLMETLSETFFASTSRKWFPVKRTGNMMRFLRYHNELVTNIYISRVLSLSMSNLLSTIMFQVHWCCFFSLEQYLLIT